MVRSFLSLTRGFPEAFSKKHCVDTICDSFFIPAKKYIGKKSNKAQPAELNG